MRVVATYNFKGGVGKTASAVNLGWLAARDGLRTLVWDLDPQGAASYTFRVEPELEVGAPRWVRGRADPAAALRATDYERLDLLPADFSNRHLDVALGREARPERALGRVLEPLAAAYDLVVLDCAPSISTTSEAIFGTAEALLAPTIPTTLSLRTLARLLRHLKKVERRPRVLPFFCMVDGRKALHRSVRAFAREHRLGFLGAEIPYSSAVERMSVRREPLFAFAPRDPAARAYEALWTEVRGELDRRGPDAGPRGADVRALLADVAGSSSPRGARAEA